MITGLDLVELQYNIAFGGKAPEDITFNKHSIECRITAEDPKKNFMPVSGKILVFEYPENVRIDTFIEEGTEITPFYDSLICKVIVKGKNRLEAIQNMIFALTNLTILPIKTNKNLLLDIVKSEPFIREETHTNFIPMYFSNWQEKYKPILNEKIVGSVFNKYRSLVLTKQGYETNRSENKIQDLSMWTV